jgi:acetylglutamate kinase
MSTYVVKVGGHALDSLEPDSKELATLAGDVATLWDQGTSVVVVHGGGPQIQALLTATGMESRFHEGLRITDEATMEIVAMALSQVNVHLVAAFNRAGLASAGLSGVDGSMLRSSILSGPWGRAGTTPKVDTALIETLWAKGVTPIVSPVAVDEHSELVNCNADTAAGAIAGALNATALVLLSDVDQLRSDPDDPASALSHVREEDLRRLLDGGAARDGMRPKATAALDALDGGARRVLIANGTTPHALRDALAGAIPTTEIVR